MSIERALDDLVNALDGINETGLYWLVDGDDIEITVHDPEDGMRPLYRVYSGRAGTEWESYG